MPRLYCPGRLRPELFPGIGVLPGPASESHIVNRGTPVAPFVHLRTAAAECPGEEELVTVKVGLNKSSSSSMTMTMTVT